jgi:hypothetical protein
LGKPEKPAKTLQRTSAALINSKPKPRLGFEELSPGFTAGKRGFQEIFSRFVKRGADLAHAGAARMFSRVLGCWVWGWLRRARKVGETWANVVCWAVLGGWVTGPGAGARKTMQGAWFFGREKAPVGPGLVGWGPGQAAGAVSTGAMVTGSSSTAGLGALVLRLLALSEF